MGRVLQRRLDGGSNNSEPLQLGNRYGIVHVDFTTQKRTPKVGASFFKEVARQNALA